MGKILLMLDVDIVSCGGVELPRGTINLISIGITILQVAVPLILIIMGMLDFVKATTTSKEDQIKKAQSTFIRRLIMGVVVFLVIVIVKIVVGLLPNTDGSLDCIKLILGGTSSTETSIESGAPSNEVGDLLTACGNPDNDEDPDACRCRVCKENPNDTYCKKNVDIYCK
ncbi:MAG: hypothetical protein NC181_04535 [Clostridium sp.]|nr:hypothetical protein [Clostridium sp.]MCM1444558.1 hypothetical protein [Candidatus Amulumruptor caecigallinarius]